MFKHPKKGNHIDIILVPTLASKADNTGNPPSSYKDVSTLDQILKPRVLSVCDVDVRGDMSKSSPATYARTNRREIQLGEIDEAISEPRDSVIPAVSSRKTFVGGLLLSDRDSNTTLAISLWSSEADMLSNQPLGLTHSLLALLCGLSAR